MKVEEIYIERTERLYTPVSVVITHSEESAPRRAFLYDFCLPSVLSAGPGQIILVSGPGTAGAKRNAGAKFAKHPLLVFWDDDTVMATSYIRTMKGALQTDGGASFAYCDALEIVHPEAPEHPFQGVKLRRSRPWDPGALRKGNYVSGMSLMHRDAFPGCDETLKRLVDYDMWLTMLDQGRHGVYVPEVLYHAYYLDRGITAGSTSYQEALRAVRAKHPR